MLHSSQIKFKKQRTNVYRIHTDENYPCFRREPVAAQQKSPSDSASFRLVVVGTWKQRDARPLITRIRQIPQTIIEDLDPLEEFVTFIHSTGNSQENVPQTVKDVPGSSTSRNDETEVDHVLEKIRNTCPFCDKRFDSVKKVETHVACVHRRPYQCDKCKKSWRTAEALEEHKVIHRPDYFFECDVCHVKYKSECSLKRHKLRMHSGQESKYVCEHCGRCYKLKMDLSEHVKKIHMTEPQICRFCGKAVKDVKAHEWKHQNHKRYREAKYNLSCHLCQKKFCHRSRLDCHLRRHEEGFRCEICDKDFLSTKELVRHKQYKHGQTKIYTCIVCKKPFVCSSNFYQHVLTHAGIRPYKCDVCEEDFTQRSSLLRHRRQHPGPLSPLPSTNPRITELAKSYLQKLQNDQIDKSCVLNAKF